MTPGDEFRLYMKAANRDQRNSSDSHLSEATLIAYYRAELSAVERETAQAHLVTCAACIALLQSVSDFLEPAGSDDEDVTAAETNAEWQSFLQRVNFKPAPDKRFVMDSRLTLAMAASLLISLGAVGWLAWSYWQERQSRRQSQEVAAELQQRQRELEQRLAQVTESSAREREQRLAAEAERNKLQDLLAAANPAVDDTRVYPFTLAFDRGAADELQMKLNAAAEVQLLIGKPDAFGEYEVDVHDEGGRSVRTFRRLRPQGIDRRLHFRLNRGALSPGKYKLRLSGRQGSTSTQLGEYGLVVTN